MPTKPGTYATFKTSEGTIVVELFEKDAPQTVANFIGLAEGTKEWNSRSKKGAKLYDGTIFHRVIPNFMIQGGDPEGSGMGGPGYKFADETKGSPHGFQKPGKLAMANAGPNTNGSQFFISRRRLRRGREDQQSPHRLPGQTEDTRRPRIRHHRARGLTPSHGLAKEGPLISSGPSVLSVQLALSLCPTACQSRCKAPSPHPPTCSEQPAPPPSA
jgi:cyclophilin family peptidyl-prolyl cis-trans isomerase